MLQLRGEQRLRHNTDRDWITLEKRHFLSWVGIVRVCKVSKCVFGSPSGQTYSLHLSSCGVVGPDLPYVALALQMTCADLCDLPGLHVFGFCISAGAAGKHS